MKYSLAASISLIAAVAASAALGTTVAQVAPGQNAQVRSAPGLTEMLGQRGNFSTFVKLWNVAGLSHSGGADLARRNSSSPGGKTKGQGGVAVLPASITILAPNDAAFAAMDGKRLAALIADKAKLRQFLLAHVIPQTVHVSQMFKPIERSRTEFRNAQGWVLGFSCDGRHSGMHNPLINDKARVGTFQDVQTREGIVHEIDRLLAP
jgi:uncharacterized surface protein with fasciclin (FAS1) repeats